jgi:hypothetical protein
MSAKRFPLRQSLNSWEPGDWRKHTTMFFCRDCHRRFFNKSWHAEVCGSSNYVWFSPEVVAGVLAQSTAGGTEKTPLSAVPPASPKETK